MYAILKSFQVSFNEQSNKYHHKICDWFLKSQHIQVAI